MFDDAISGVAEKLGQFLRHVLGSAKVDLRIIMIWIISFFIDLLEFSFSSRFFIIFCSTVSFIKKFWAEMLAPTA